MVENDATPPPGRDPLRGRHSQPNTVTVGTGLGGGVVVGGELIRGAFGAAAEVGHLNIVPGGRPCGVRQRRLLEQYASGRALVTEARQRAARAPKEARLLLELGDSRSPGRW